MPAHYIKWPKDEVILAAAPEAGSLAELARNLGVGGSYRGWLNHLDGRKIKDKAASLLQHKKPQEPPPPVDDPERIKADQQQAEMAQLRKENRDLRKALASQEDFFNRIIAATKIEVSTPRYKVRRQRKALPAESIVCPIYDQQYGQFVRPSDTPGARGGFSIEVFDQRLARYVDAWKGIAEDRARSYRLNELIIILGGDQVEGDEIFPGQTWQLQTDPPQQVWQLATKLSDAITQMIAFAKEDLGVPLVGIYAVPGNHGAVGGRKAGARPSTYSWDWLLYKLLLDSEQGMLRSQPINQAAIEAGGSIFFLCAGHQFQAIHGDEVRGWGGLPFYGLTRLHGRSQAYHQRLYRYCIMGHHHQSAEIPNGTTETFVSGAWVGANNLSRQMLVADRPQQKVLFVSERFGVDAAERIYFAETDEAYHPSPIHELTPAA